MRSWCIINDVDALIYHSPMYVRILIFLFLTIASFGIACRDSNVKRIGLEIVEQNENYVLTIPRSRLVMTVPKGGLTMVFPKPQKSTGQFIVETVFGKPADGMF